MLPTDPRRSHRRQSCAKGQGLVVHTSECRGIGKTHHDRDNWVEVEWEQANGALFETSIRIVTENRRGVLARMAAVIAAATPTFRTSASTKTRASTTALQFTLQVTNRVHLARIIRSLRRIPEVMRISRTRE